MTDAPQCSCLFKNKHHRCQEIADADRCPEWVRRGGLETRCMDIRGHEERGYPEHSLDLRGKQIDDYQVTCRWKDFQTQNGHWIPIWRCQNLRTNQVQMLFEFELVQLSMRDPRSQE